MQKEVSLQLPVIHLLHKFSVLLILYIIHVRSLYILENVLVCILFQTLSVHIVLNANPDHLASSWQQNLPKDCNSTSSSGVNGNSVNLDTDFPTEGMGFRFISLNLLSFLKKNVGV
jgi:hypothetical protein